MSCGSPIPRGERRAKPAEWGHSQGRCFFWCSGRKDGAMTLPLPRSVVSSVFALLIAACTSGDRPTAPILPKSSSSASQSSPPDIIVNTTSDEADFGGSQREGDLHGPDGRRELREAIIAARNKTGLHILEFPIPSRN